MPVCPHFALFLYVSEVLLDPIYLYVVVPFHLDDPAFVVPFHLDLRGPCRPVSPRKTPRFNGDL